MFNINEFKSVMNKYGGPAKSNLFVMALIPSVSTQRGVGTVFTRKNEYIDPGELRFFCSEVSVPPVNINVAFYRANSIDIAQSMPTNLTTPSINATFMLDSEHRVLSFFHSWMQEIINYNARNGLLSSVGENQLPYEIGYKSDYTCTLEITHFKTNAKGDGIEQGYTYQFDNAFPTEVGGKNFSWMPNDSIASFTVNFTASSYSFTAAEFGSPVNILSRGNGFLDVLTSVGFRGQTVQQRNLPTSVQDAINTFTTVRNDFRTVRNTFRSLSDIF